MTLISRAYLRPTSICLQCWRRSFAATALYRETQMEAPPMLARFRTDMKEAMKAKDIQRLNTLRGILTETTSLEKRSQGIKSDKELFKLLQKRQKASSVAAKEFQDAGREDLVSKENEQIGVLQGYLDEFDVMSTDRVVTAVRDLVQWMESKGSSPRRETVRKQLFQEGGAFHNKIVNEGLVTSTINDLVKEIPSPKSSSEKKSKGQGTR
ncbi:MAG: hypothetical protein Q9225_007025 [Loekoesia sp. 1 TL-2023]